VLFGASGSRDCNALHTRRHCCHASCLTVTAMTLAQQELADSLNMHASASRAARAGMLPRPHHPLLHVVPEHIQARRAANKAAIARATRAHATNHLLSSPERAETSAAPDIRSSTARCAGQGQGAAPRARPRRRRPHRSVGCQWPDVQGDWWPLVFLVSRM